MSIALSIIDLATGQAEKENAWKIVEIELDIGTVSGVEIDALNFALEIAVKDTLLESARVKINTIEAVAECLGCGNIFEALRYMNQCPRCREVNTRIVRGKEMQVKSLLVE